MREVLLGLLIMGVVAWTACALAALWVRHRVRRRLRISPAVRSAAPTVWLASLSASARLHHRLRRVGASARAAGTLDPSLAGLADELVRSAVMLEPAVVAVARTGHQGASARRDVSAQIWELELVGRRLTALSMQAAEAPDAMHLRDRVGALEAARQELGDIERAVGLHVRA